MKCVGKTKRRDKNIFYRGEKEFLISIVENRISDFAPVKGQTLFAKRLPRSLLRAFTTDHIRRYFISAL